MQRPTFHFTRGMTFRLALAYSAWFVVSYAAMGAIAWWMFVTAPLAEVRATVLAEVRTLSALHEKHGVDALVDALAVRREGPSRRRAFHALVAPDGDWITANIPAPPPLVQSPWFRFEFETFDGGIARENEAYTYEQRFADGTRLLIARDTEDVDEREELIGQAIGWGTAVALALGLIGGVLTSRAVGRRIDAIAGTAERVMAGDLTGRVALRGTGDDFDHLAETLNAMLDRIENLIQSVARVSDSIAHELRTPLARIRADLEELDSADDVATRKALIAQANESAARLQSTFDALLRIARIEAGRHTLAAESVNLSALVSDAAELYAPAAAAGRLQLESAVEPGIRVWGDRDLLFQAVTNLIDNAAKYTPAGGSVRVALTRDGAGAQISVADTGPGVDAADLPRITERFFRAPAQAAAAGQGLGLALVEAVARCHRAELGFRNQNPGLTATLRLPLAN